MYQIFNLYLVNKIYIFYWFDILLNKINFVNESYVYIIKT